MRNSKSFHPFDLSAWCGYCNGRGGGSARSQHWQPGAFGRFCHSIWDIWDGLRFPHRPEVCASLRPPAVLASLRKERARRLPWWLYGMGRCLGEFFFRRLFHAQQMRIRAKIFDKKLKVVGMSQIDSEVLEFPFSLASATSQKRLVH